MPAGCAATRRQAFVGKYTENFGLLSCADRPKQSQKLKGGVRLFL